MIIAKYKANSTDCLPTFNGGYIYTSSYVDNGDGTYTFTLESDNNFTSVHFQQKQSLLSVEKLAITSSCTALNSLFNSCSNLTSVNTQGWDTSNVTTFWALCYQCPNLLEIDVSKFDTSNADNMYAMFYGCNKLTSLDVSNFNTSQATNMEGIFNACKALTSLDVSNWDTSKVTNMASMFANCSSLVSLNLSSFDTGKVTSMASMFAGCSSLVSLDLSSFNTSKVVNMSGMVRDCKSLVKLNLSSFDTSIVTTMYAMFYYSTNLASLDISNFTITDSTNVSNIFDALNLSEIGMLYCDKTTIDKVTSKLPSSSKSNIYVLDEDISNLNKLDNITFIKALEYEEEITLPYQMAKVDGVKDRLYYDESIGKYILEKNIDEDFNVAEKQVIETDIDLMELDTYDTTYITVTSRLDSELKVNEEYCKLDILSSDGGENNINNELFLNEPLRRIGNISDRLYWDFTKEKYIIERNIGRLVLNGSESWARELTLTNTNSYRTPIDSTVKPQSPLICDKFIHNTNYSLDMEHIYIGLTYLNLYITKTKLEGYGSVKDWLAENPVTVIYELAEPYYEELDINRMDLKSYIPTTHLTTPNIPLKTSITVDTNIAKYKPLELLPDTKYTLLVDAMGGENDIVNVDLGGATNRFKPTQYTYGKNKVSITTPSTLSTDYLSIYGETNKVKDIMLIQGDVNQHPEYFDGTQSTGELQGDGSYKIDILSQSETLDSRDIQGNIPITLEGISEGKYISIDEIYGNTWQDTENVKNLVDINNMQEKAVGFNGVLSDLTSDSINCRCTQYIEVKPNTDYYLTITKKDDTLSGNGSYFHFYDESKTSVGVTQLTDSGFNRKYTSPTNAKYAVISFGDMSNINTIQLEEGSTPTDYAPFYKDVLSDIRSVGELQEDGTYKVDIGTYICDLFELSDIDQIYAFKPLALMTVEKFEPVKHLFNKVSGYATANNLYDYYYIDGTNVWVYVGETDKTNAVKVLNDHIIKNTKPEIKSSIYLPQPLRAIGEFKDRLYWDDEKGKYCIEKKVFEFKLADLFNKSCLINDLGTMIRSYGIISHINIPVGSKSFYQPNGKGIISNHIIDPTNNDVGLRTGFNDVSIVVYKEDGVTYNKTYFIDYCNTHDVTVYALFTEGGQYGSANHMLSEIIETDITEKISLNSYNETTYITTNSNVEHEIKGLYDEVKSHNVSILLDSPLTNDDKIYYDNGYKVSRNGSIETPVIKGDEINLPKLYQGINTYINTTTGNIKPSEIKVEYKEFS